MHRTQHFAPLLCLATVASTGCVVTPSHPGVVEPGAAVRARFDPAAAVTNVENGREDRVERLTGRVVTVDTAGFVLTVRSAQRADGRRSTRMAGTRVRVPASARPEVHILAGDAQSSEIATLAVVGGVTAAVAMLGRALLGGD